MTAQLLEGRPVADAIWAKAQKGAQQFQVQYGRPPTVTIIQSADGAAQAYARQISRAFQRRDLGVRLADPPTSDAELQLLAASLREDDGVDGVILMTPLAPGLDGKAAIAAIGPEKDVDGQHSSNLGGLVQRGGAFTSSPSTALGGIRMLEHYGISPSGKKTVVIGRSPIVGLPLALLLIQRDATVTVCHSRTANLTEVAHDADLLCVAMGRAGFVGVDHVKPGAVVLDFGTNAKDDGSLVGDVQTDAVAEVASAITPVPGGAGPVTVAVLAEQTLAAALARRQSA